MDKRTKLFAAFVLAPLWFCAAAAPAFDVASVKPSTPGTGEGRGKENIETSPGSLSLRSVTLSSCIKWAYGVQDYQISAPASGLGWINSERYDIAAKAERPASEDQLKLMLQTLLADRFQLTLHRQSKELPVFALMVAKNGPKFHESEGEGKPDLQLGKASAVAKRVPISDLANLLAGPLQTPVVDMTGLKGRYDFSIDLLSYVGDVERPGPALDIAAVIISALQEQLGLRLESKKSPVEMLVVDRAARPSEN